jgi:hypothetical protein
MLPPRCGACALQRSRRCYGEAWSARRSHGHPAIFEHAHNRFAGETVDRLGVTSSGNPHEPRKRVVACRSAIALDCAQDEDDCRPLITRCRTRRHRAPGRTCHSTWSLPNRFPKSDRRTCAVVDTFLRTGRPRGRLAPEADRSALPPHCPPARRQPIPAESREAIAQMIRYRSLIRETTCVATAPTRSKNG